MTNDKIADHEIFKKEREILINYLTLMVMRSDWHGVSDAANDLRVLEAEYKGRQ